MRAGAQESEEFAFGSVQYDPSRFVIKVFYGDYSAMVVRQFFTLTNLHFFKLSYVLLQIADNSFFIDRSRVELDSRCLGL